MLNTLVKQRDGFTDKFGRSDEQKHTKYKQKEKEKEKEKKER